MGHARKNILTMPGIIPPETVEQVRQATDIVDFIGSYVPL